MCPLIVIVFVIKKFITSHSVKSVKESRMKSEIWSNLGIPSVRRATALMIDRSYEKLKEERLI